MTACLARLIGYIVPAALIAFLPVAAGAQPVQLRPPTASQPVPSDQEQPGTITTEADPQPASSGASETPASSDQKAEIVVDALEEVDPGAFGLIGQAEGGFPSSLWNGTEWSVVKAMMPRMPDQTRWNTVRTLAIRLLTSRAVVPEGKPAQDNFIQIRMERLAAMGEAGHALELLGAVPVNARNEALAKQGIELLFLQNRNDEACKQIRAVSGGFSESYWDQARAFCLALDGNHASAILISELLREHEDGVDPTFFDIIEALGGVKGIEIPSISTPSGLVLSMMRVANLQLPPVVNEVSSPLILRWIARAPNTTIEERLLAAEKSLLAGSLSAEEILRIYSGTPVSSEALRNAISWAETNWSPRARALLMRLATSQSTPLAKAEVLRRTLEIARQHGNHTETVRAASPIIEEMTPGPELVWFAEDAARSLFATGRITEALAWYEIVVKNRDQLEEASSIEADLWPLAVLSGAESATSALPQRLVPWLSDSLKDADDGAVKRSQLFMSLIEASGHEVPAQAWRQLAIAASGKGEALANYAWHRLLEHSAANNRVGETVLLAIVGAAGNEDKAYMGVAAAHAVNSLYTIGRDNSARRLALESALAGGL